MAANAAQVSKPVPAQFPHGVPWRRTAHDTLVKPKLSAGAKPLADGWKCNARGRAQLLGLW